MKSNLINRVYNELNTYESNDKMWGCTYIKTRYKDNKTPITLVSNQNGNITVQFPNDIRQEAREEVIEQLDFFFGKKNEKNPWAYVIYHCSTASNIYSAVHWGYYPKGYKGK